MKADTRSGGRRRCAMLSILAVCAATTPLQGCRRTAPDAGGPPPVFAESAIARYCVGPPEGRSAAKRQLLALVAAALPLLLDEFRTCAKCSPLDAKRLFVALPMDASEKGRALLNLARSETCAGNWRIAMALRALGDDASQALLEGLADSNAEVRFTALTASAKGAITDPKLLSAVIERLTDPHPRIRIRAALAVAWHADRARDHELPWKLAALLRDPDADVRRAALGVMSSVTFRLAKTKAEERTLLLALASDSDPFIRSRAKRRLSDLDVTWQIRDWFLPYVPPEFRGAEPN